MKINRLELLDLYDAHQIDGGLPTAVSALCGEEFGIGLLQRYLDSKGRRVKRLPGIPKTGKKSGFRLDGWLLIDDELMQVEVKNWGANAVNGRKYDGDTQKGWNQFLAWWKDPGLRKVLWPMQPPPEHTVIHHAVACIWPVMNPHNLDEPWFAVPVSELPALGFETGFDQLYVFSMSGYLHSLEEEWLDVPMPIMEKRLQRINSIFIHS
jgi:hypothetical protein